MASFNPNQERMGPDDSLSKHAIKSSTAAPESIPSYQPIPMKKTGSLIAHWTYTPTKWQGDEYSGRHIPDCDPVKYQGRIVGYVKGENNVEAIILITDVDNKSYLTNKSIDDLGYVTEEYEPV